MIRAVIDTNVALSALLWWGEPAKLLRNAQSGKLQILVTNSILNELQRVISSKKFAKRFAQLNSTPEEPLTFYRNLVLFCKEPPESDIKCRDSDDLIFIDLAIEEKAHIIVSGDNHLLNLKKTKNIPILTPRQANCLLDELNKR